MPERVARHRGVARRRRDQALRRSRCRGQHVVRACEERSAGTDRPERLRQDHDAEHDLRRPEADRRRNPAPRQGHFGCAGKRDRGPRRCPHVSDRAHAAVADGAGERRRRRRVRPQPALGPRARRLRPRPAATGRPARRRRRLGRGAHLYRSEAGRARPRARVRSRRSCCSTNGSRVSIRPSCAPALR